jgi:hypothetical protein
MGADGSMISTDTLYFDEGLKMDRSSFVSTDDAGSLEEYWIWSNTALTLFAGTYAYVGSSASAIFKKTGNVKPALVKATGLTSVSSGEDIFVGCFGYTTSGLFSSSQIRIDGGSAKVSNKATSANSKVTSEQSASGQAHDVQAVSWGEKGNLAAEPYQKSKLFLGPGYGESPYQHFAMAYARSTENGVLTADDIGEQSAFSAGGSAFCTPFSAGATGTFIASNTFAGETMTITTSGKGARQDKVVMVPPTGGFGDMAFPQFLDSANVMTMLLGSTKTSVYSTADSKSSEQKAVQRLIASSGRNLWKGGEASAKNGKTRLIAIEDTLSRAYEAGVAVAPSEAVVIPASLSGSDTAVSKGNHAGVDSTVNAKAAFITQRSAAYEWDQSVYPVPDLDEKWFDGHFVFSEIRVFGYERSVWDPDLEKDVIVHALPLGQSMLEGKSSASAAYGKAQLKESWRGTISTDITAYGDQKIRGDSLDAQVVSKRKSSDATGFLQYDTADGGWSFSRKTEALSSSNGLLATIS